MLVGNVWLFIAAAGLVATAVCSRQVGKCSKLMLEYFNKFKIKLMDYYSIPYTNPHEINTKRGSSFDLESFALTLTALIRTHK